MTVPLVPAQGSLEAMQQRYGERYRWLLLMAVMVGSITAIMSSTIVNVAIPDMSHFFGLGQDRAQWVGSSFMAASSTTMLTTPWMLARLGYRRTYTLCMALLLTGGVLGGLSQTYTWVLVARVLEGLATGMVQPIPAIVILRAFPHSQQGRASGLFGMGVVLAPSVGPSVGGLLIDAFGWRSIFFMVVPFTLLSMLLARKLVPVSAPGGKAAQADASMDWLGLALASVGTVSLLNALVAVRHDSGTWAPWLGLLSLASWGAFLHWQRRARSSLPARQPLIDPELFAVDAFAKGCVVAFAYGVVLFGSTYLYPAYLQLGLQLPASSVGALLLPSGLLMAVVIVVGGRLADRFSLHKIMTAGLLILAVSLIAISFLQAGKSLAGLIALTTLGRVGMGLILPSLNLVALRGMPREWITQGASTVAFVRMLGGAVGVSLCGTFLQWRLSAVEQASRPAQAQAARFSAFHQSFWILAAFCALALMAAWRMRDMGPPPPVRTSAH